MNKILSSRNPGHVELKATIGYQENQIKNLLDRIEVLSREVGALTLDRNAQKQDRIKQIDLNDSRLQILEALEQANKYQEGYIARVKEEDHHRYGDLPKEI